MQYQVFLLETILTFFQIFLIRMTHFSIFSTGYALSGSPVKKAQAVSARIIFAYKYSHELNEWTSLFRFL